MQENAGQHFVQNMLLLPDIAAILYCVYTARHISCDHIRCMSIATEMIPTAEALYAYKLCIHSQLICSVAGVMIYWSIDGLEK
jgi:hypothetical protein